MDKRNGTNDFWIANAMPKCNKKFQCLSICRGKAFGETFDLAPSLKLRYSDASSSEMHFVFDGQFSKYALAHCAHICVILRWFS